ncbi:hypothetical protein XCCB1459_1055 [Xanthomonas campestris pv. campestris]|nr:hypothetical protein XCCB1459_1055 [Xanthomonas campestris pv. campestris]
MGSSRSRGSPLGSNAPSNPGPAAVDQGARDRLLRSGAAPSRPQRIATPVAALQGRCHEVRPAAIGGAPSGEAAPHGRERVARLPGEQSGAWDLVDAGGLEAAARASTEHPRSPSRRVDRCKGQGDPGGTSALRERSVGQRGASGGLEPGHASALSPAARHGESTGRAPSRPCCRRTSYPCLRSQAAALPLKPKSPAVRGSFWHGSEWPGDGNT